MLLAGKLVRDLLDKRRFQQLAETLGLRVPRARRRDPDGDGPTSGREVVVSDAPALATLHPRLTEVRGRRPRAEAHRWPETAIECWHAYFDPPRSVTADYTGTKIRTWPLSCRLSSALPVTATDVWGAGRDVVDRLGVHGLAKVDSKRDPQERLHLPKVDQRGPGSLQPSARGAPGGLRGSARRPDRQAASGGGVAAWDHPARAAGRPLGNPGVGSLQRRVAEAGCRSAPQGRARTGGTPRRYSVAGRAGGHPEPACPRPAAAGPVTRSAVLSDVHSNRDELRVAVAALQAAEVVALLHLGDVVGYGPRPQRSLYLVRSFKPAAVTGSHEQMVLGRLSSERRTPSVQSSPSWSKTQMGPAALAGFEGLPVVREVPGAVLAHASPDRVEEYVRCSQRGVVLEPGHRFRLNPETLGQSRDHRGQTRFLVLDRPASVALFRSRDVLRRHGLRP